MTSADELFSQIAFEHLSIATLTCRQPGRWNYHRGAVWQVKAALRAAFDAGAATARPRPAPEHGLPARFDDYEIQPCRRYRDADDPDLAFVEPCAAFEADFWTVYGHIPGEGVQAIGDFDTRQH